MMWREKNWVRGVLRVRGWLIVAVLAVSFAVSLPAPARVGDRLQIALPMLGLGCAVLTGGAGEYLLRFGLLEVAMHGTKAGLGAAAINQRPDGGGRGFPSGHTAAAAFGASALVQECVRNSPFVQGVALIAAGFTGASRIEARAHTIWQVLAGAVLGWGMERLLRRPSRPRRWLVGWWRALFRRRRAGAGAEQKRETE